MKEQLKEQRIDKVSDVATIGHYSEAINLTRAGISVSEAERERQRLGISVRAFVRILGYSERQWQRLRVDGEHARLPSVQTDRLLRFLRVSKEADKVFDTSEDVRAWFSLPNRALAGETPLSLMDTDMGVEQVSEVLGRIRYSIYS